MWDFAERHKASENEGLLSLAEPNTNILNQLQAKVPFEQNSPEAYRALLRQNINSRAHAASMSLRNIEKETDLLNKRAELQGKLDTVLEQR